MNEFYKKFNIHALPAGTPACSAWALVSSRDRKCQRLMG